MGKRKRRLKTKDTVQLVTDLARCLSIYVVLFVSYLHNR